MDIHLMPYEIQSRSFALHRRLFFVRHFDLLAYLVWTLQFVKILFLEGLKASTDFLREQKLKFRSTRTGANKNGREQAIQNRIKCIKTHFGRNLCSKNKNQSQGSH